MANRRRSTVRALLEGKHGSLSEIESCKVVPHVGVGAVRLGMSRDDSRVAMGLLLQSFNDDVSELANDAYILDEGRSGFYVFFDADDRVEYIELSGVSNAVYKETLIFSTLAEQLTEIISRDADYDPDDPELGYAYTYPQLELALWRSAKPDIDSDNIEEGKFFAIIGIGKAGYFSSRVKS